MSRLRLVWICWGTKPEGKACELYYVWDWCEFVGEQNDKLQAIHPITFEIGVNLLGNKTADRHPLASRRLRLVWICWGTKLTTPREIHPCVWDWCEFVGEQNNWSGVHRDSAFEIGVNLLGNKTTDEGDGFIGRLRLVWICWGTKLKLNDLGVICGLRLVWICWGTKPSLGGNVQKVVWDWCEFVGEQNFLAESADAI